MTNAGIDPADPWSQAQWIWLREDQTPERDFYRAIFVREQRVPGAVRARIFVTADALYQFWINNAQAARGPLRGDLDHYRFDALTVELEQEEIILVAAVIPPNSALATGEIHHSAGFLLEAVFEDGEGREIARICTDPRWSCAVDPAFDRNACDDAHWDKTPMGAAGYGELIDFRKHTRFAQEGLRTALDWHPARTVAFPHDATATGKTLEPTPLPRQEMTAQPLGVFFRPGQGEYELPVHLAREKDRIFLDHEVLTTGYPRLTFRGGEGRRVRISYAETLVEGVYDGLSEVQKIGRQERFHHRTDATAAADIFPMAYYDEILLGADETIYQPSYLRTFRFLRIEIEPGADPATIINGNHHFSAYPFARRAEFAASDTSLEPLCDVAFRTMRLCAHDHFEDCPYYERLQYGGDTGLQALMSYAVTGDTRLGRQAMEQLAWSRAPKDARLTLARYPSSTNQVIPTFSLFWLTYAEDFLRFTDDLEPVRAVAERMAEVVDHFAEVQQDGWIPDEQGNFVDWAWGHCLEGFKMPRTAEGYSSIVNLQAAWCLQSACRTFRRLERTADADRAAALAQDFCRAVITQAIDGTDSVILDGPGLTDRSQHAQIWAILTDAVPRDHQERLFPAALDDPAMVRSSLYHDVFLFRAAAKLGREVYARVWPMIQTWRDLVAEGFSTFPEEDGRHGFIRSECHAWTAWIFHEFLERILGIQVVSKREVVIRPYPCNLLWARGAMPLGAGEVRVEWERDDDSDDRLTVKVAVPEETVVHWELPPSSEKHLRRT